MNNSYTEVYFYKYCRTCVHFEKAGFEEYGRNPKGFHSRITGFQEVIYMRLEL